MTIRYLTLVKKILSVWIVLVGSLFANLVYSAEPSGCFSSEEKKLFDEINAYRGENSLGAVASSKSLTSVGQWHVIDLFENRPDTGFDHGQACNLHSWSNTRPDLWEPVCYTSDHMFAAQMWAKPRQLTKGVYSSNGYENSFGGGSPSYVATADDALNSWKNSPGHKAVILEQGIWAGRNWPAMGLAIYKNYAVLWFGDQVDPQGMVSECEEMPSPPTPPTNSGSPATFLPAILDLLL